MTSRMILEGKYLWRLHLGDPLIDWRFRNHQPKIYSSSCASDAQDLQDAQDVNSHSGCDVDPTPRPEDSLNVPLRPDNVLKRTLRPVRPDAFRR